MMPGALVLAIPSLASRADVRRISQHVSDLAGVAALSVDLEQRTLTVHGDVPLAAVSAAVAAAGHAVILPRA